MNPSTDTRRASEALHRAVAAEPDDFLHPGYEQLEALVDGRLDDADREVVETHIELCAICAEDVADISSVRDDIKIVTPGQTGRSRAWIRVAQIAAVLIAAVAIIFVVRQRNTPATVARGPETPAPVASPTTPASKLTFDERALVDRVLAAGALEIPAATVALAPRTGTLLGAAPTTVTLTVMSPIGTAVVSPLPEFSWRALTGAVSYSVSVFDDQFNQVAQSARVTTTTWTPTKPLPRAKTLAWQVTAHLPGRDVLAPAPPQPEARFAVVDEVTATTIAEQQVRLSEQPLVLGVLLAKAGLFADASRELTRAVAQADTAERAKVLLAGLKK